MRKPLMEEYKDTLTETIYYIVEALIEQGKAAQIDVPVIILEAVRHFENGGK